MDINARFRIEIRYVTGQGEDRIISVLASDFFDIEGYDDSEWGCDLPWRLTSLDEHLPPGGAPPIEITATITDNQSGQQRRLHVQALLANRLTLSWDDFQRSPGVFEVILDLGRDKVSESQIARIDVVNGQARLTSHLLIDGDSCKSLLPDSEK